MRDVLRSVVAFYTTHFLKCTIIPLLILLVGASYARFIVLNDYLVSYESDCDPYTESCFEGCEDDTCTETYFYSIIERHASEIYQLCGPDVLECDEAWECQEGVQTCSITYCDPSEGAEDVCVSLIEDES